MRLSPRDSLLPPAFVLGCLLLTAGCMGDGGVITCGTFPIDGATVDDASDTGSDSEEETDASAETAADATADAAVPDDAGPTNSNAQLTVRASYDGTPDGGIVTSVWLREAFDAGCSVSSLEGCSVRSCPESATSAAPLAAGILRLSGRLATCELATIGAGSACPTLWQPDIANQTLELSAKGGLFPAFDASVPTPTRIALESPSVAPGALLPRGQTFRWNTLRATGMVEVELARSPTCSSTPPNPALSAVCSAPGDGGVLAIPEAVFTALATEKCLAASIVQRTTQRESVQDRELEIAVELVRDPAFLFESTEPTCRGSHAACATFASNEPSGCTRHGCKWDSGACIGIPHSCAEVPLAECDTATLPHAGCTRRTP